MVRTIKDIVAALPDDTKNRLSRRARDGESITAISGDEELDYAVVQTHLWESGTLPWQGAKTVITRRLKTLRAASKRQDRDQLVDDVAQQVDYLYYAARELQKRWDKVESLAPSSERS